ncbi:VCBS repeat-containing protein [bacterium]|nr:VCBS repeat-containing protein [Mariniblastus sp.]MDA7923116.1 VCBS repeat-containing protein [bacterium]MDA7926121.1 VCBS repeat-containing protein [Mariniblastus sp.]MDB4461559.1 VCBS repeat-containing protein [bacterium]
MSSQLVDLNGDGNHDVLVGSFSGSPHWIEGSEQGFLPAAALKDRDEKDILISAFWNTEDKKWDKSDRSGTEGHCTSVAAVDWEGDGDLDLILGGYYEGGLFLRINEGTATEPKFAQENTAIQAEGGPMVVKGGLSTPRVVDWDGDGKFDLLCGGSKGGVFFYKNVGDKSTPQFASAEVLIEPIVDSSYVKRVPTSEGQPTQPGSSFHIDAVDYDQDGDLDLLVGGRCSWEKENVPVLTAEQEARLAELTTEIGLMMPKISEMSKTLSESGEKPRDNEDYQKLMRAYSKLNRESSKLRVSPFDSGDFVWLYRRK